MFAIFGLGNPGTRYSHTRHNIGFEIVRCIAERWDLPYPSRNKYSSTFSEGKVKGQSTLLVLPQTFMNLSGKAVAGVMAAKRILLAKCIVIHDELALPFGTVRCKNGGGHGGHNGLRNINQTVGNGYLRVRFGIGDSPMGRDQAGYVLGRFTSNESLELDALINHSVDCIESILDEGIDSAMNIYNVRQS